MSYGCGNYMYRGDPGFFGNLFHGLVGTVGGAIKGFVLSGGNPAGAIAGAAAGAFHATASNIGDATLAAGGDASALTPELRAKHAAAVARARSDPFGRGATVVHTTHGPMVVHGGRRRRRMNWANGKALSRAERRMMSFLHHARRFIKLSHPRAVGVHLKFHKKRRRAA